MKIALSICAILCLSTAANAQTTPSTTSSVPTGYQVRGSTDYRLVNGPNWQVRQIRDVCAARELGRSDSKCVTVGNGATATAGPASPQ